MSPTRPVRMITSALFLSVALGFGGCNSIYLRQATLLNADTALPIHIFKVSEGFDPDNRLEPLGAETTSRVVTIQESETVGGEITFIAGRGGVELGRVTCSVTRDPDGDSSTPDLLMLTVIWDGSTLTCRSDFEEE